MIELIQSDANLFGEILATVLFLAIFALSVRGMRRGWIRRSADAGARYGEVPRTDVPGRDPDGQALCTGTTVAGSRAERVALPELFGRWRCDWWAEPDALVVRRYGGQVLRLAHARAAGLTGAHAGRAVGRGRIAIVRWRLGDEDVDTGLQFPTAGEAERFVATMNGATA